MGTGDKKVKFLRRIPKDPFTKSTDWGTRSMQDDPKSPDRIDDCDGDHHSDYFDGGANVSEVDFAVERECATQQSVHDAYGD